MLVALMNIFVAVIACTNRSGSGQANTEPTNTVENSTDFNHFEPI